KQRIRNAKEIPELRELRNQFHEKNSDHLLIFDPIGLIEHVNQFHDLIIRRTIELSEHRLTDKGRGPLPVSYAFILFGSAGRGEQTLWSDQDNGLVYEDSDDPEEAASYFQELALCIEEGLEAAGYPPCDGGVLATNELWKHSLSGWTGLLDEWFEDPAFEKVRHMLIVADARCIYGNSTLLDRLKRHFLSGVEARPGMLKNMLHNTLRHKVLLSFFGHLIREQYGEDSGGIDIKYGAYIPVVNGVRLLAIQAGLPETSTLARINKLVEGAVINKGMGLEWIEAFRTILKLRTMTPYFLEEGMYNTRGKISADDLTKELIPHLKKALRTANDLQKFVKKRIEG
ncbi:MAG TPA: DUF294 nucleotidyltransferase-like domain-containing protein, partial [Bacilli bacterium]